MSIARDVALGDVFSASSLVRLFFVKDIANFISLFFSVLMLLRSARTVLCHSLLFPSPVTLSQ